MNLFKYLIAVGMFFAIAASHAEGMPLPWPFPWAKECPVDWNQLQGRYILTDAITTKGSPDLKLAIVNQRGFRMLRVSRFAPNGKLLYDGYTLLSSDQRTVRLYLSDKLYPSGPAILATIKLHFEDDRSACSLNHLVPILTIEEVKKPAVHYKLVRAH